MPPPERTGGGWLFVHELRVTARIFQMVTQEMQRRGLNRIDGVKIRVGELSGIDSSALSFSWAASARGTSFEDISLEIEPVAVTGRCRHCHRLFDVVDLVFRCPACGSPKVDLVRGQEIEIASLTMKHADPE